MPLHRYGFIVKHTDLDMFKHHARLQSESFDMSIAGVSDVLHAQLVAQEMITKGVQLIELCGGFTQEDAQSIREAIKHHIPVGVVDYTDDERQALSEHLA